MKTIPKLTISVKYKWNSYELNTTAQLVPIMERFVKPSMDMIQRVWFEPYKQLAGDKFLREMTPKKIILVGSRNIMQMAVKY